MLTALWYASLGQTLNSEVVAALDAACRDWREQVVLGLRRQRRAWRGEPGHSDDYAAIKVLELDAERVQLARIEALSRAREAPVPASPGPHLQRGNLLAVLGYFAVEDRTRERVCSQLLRLIAG